MRTSRHHINIAGDTLLHATLLASADIRIGNGTVSKLPLCQLAVQFGNRRLFVLRNEALDGSLLMSRCLTCAASSMAPDMTIDGEMVIAGDVRVSGDQTIHVRRPAICHESSSKFSNPSGRFLRTHGRSWVFPGERLPRRRPRPADGRAWSLQRAPRRGGGRLCQCETTTRKSASLHDLERPANPSRRVIS